MTSVALLVAWGLLGGVFGSAVFYTIMEYSGKRDRLDGREMRLIAEGNMCECGHPVWDHKATHRNDGFAEAQRWGCAHTHCQCQTYWQREALTDAPPAAPRARAVGAKERLRLQPVPDSRMENER